MIGPHAQRKRCGPPSDSQRIKGTTFVLRMTRSKG